MKNIIVLLIAMLAANILADESIINVYLFKESDFKKYVLKNKKTTDLKREDISDSKYSIFKGTFHSLPNIIFTTKDLSCRLNFRHALPLFQNKKSNLVEYDITISSKKFGDITTSGTIEEKGFNEISINQEWSESKYVLIFIGENATM